MLKLLNEQICVILINNLNRHYCLIYSLWYECMMTASITLWRQKVGGDYGNMAMLPWLPFHNRLMKLSYVRQSTTKMIDFNVYNFCFFVFCKKLKLWVQPHYILNNPRIEFLSEWLIFAYHYAVNAYILICRDGITHSYYYQIISVRDCSQYANVADLWLSRLSCTFLLAALYYTVWTSITW